MATTTNITTTYAGEKLPKIISAAVLSGSTLDNGLIEILPNVKYKAVLPNLNVTGIMADATCDFDPTGTVTLTERIITPKELQVNQVLCKKDFHDTWFAMEQGMSAHDVLPKSFADYLIALQSSKVAEAVETSIWQGDQGVSGEFDGFETKLTIDAALPAANEVTGTTVTSSNVVVELGKIVDAIPAALRFDAEMGIYASQNIISAYIRSLGGFGASGLGGNGTDGKGNQWYTNGSLTFDGLPIYVAKGMTSNVAIAAQKTNLFFGTGLMSDLNEAKVIDMADIDGSQNVRIVMRFTAGVQYGNVADIVTYGIVNAAN